MTLCEQDSEQLREAYAALSERAMPSLVCPDAGRFWDALDGKRTSQDVRDLLDHTIACPACAESWRLARRLRAEAGLDADTADVLPRPRPWWQWSLAAAAVASVVLGITLGVMRFKSAVEPEASTFREAATPTIRSLVPEEVSMPRDRCVLRWTSAPSDARYNIRVATEDLTVVAKAHGLEKAEYRVPVSALSGLLAGAKLVWQVEAVLTDGSRIGSPAFLVRLE